MKSAYEIAMERMRQESGETRRLSDDQKKRIAVIEEAARAKTAEARLSIESRLASVNLDERAELERELAAEIGRIDDRAQREIDAIWAEGEGE